MTPLAQVAADRPAASPATRAEPIRDVRGLLALRPHWDELLEASGSNNPFLTFEWLHAWWTHLGRHGALRAIAAWSDDRLVAVAPLMTARAFGWLPRLEFLGGGHAGSDYLDVIVRRGYEADVLREMTTIVAGWGSTLRLDHVLEGSQAACLADALHAHGWTRETTPNGVCPVIDLAGHTWDSYLATRGPAHRANVRRRMKALQQQCNPSFERVTAESARHAALSALFGFHESRFRTRGGSSAFLTPSLRDFHHEATARMLDRDRLRMYVLRIDGEAAAVMYGFACDGRFYFYQHGFDDRYRDRSIGLVLMALTVRAALDEGMHTFDLLWGAESYKSLWASDAVHLHRIHLFPPHLGGMLHRGAVEARHQLGTLARRVLPGNSRAR